MKKFLALLLAAVMMLALCACGEEEESKADASKTEASTTDTSAEASKEESAEASEESEPAVATDITGTWIGTIDLADVITASMDPETMGEMADYIVIDEFILDLAFTFEKDDCTISFTEESMDEAITGLINTMLDGTMEYFEDTCEQQGITMEEFFAAMETTEDDFMQTMKVMYEESFNAQDLQMNEGGKYLLEDGKLYMGDELETIKDSNEYLVVEINGNTMQFKGISDALKESGAEQDDITQQVMEMLSNLTLKKK